MHLVEENLFKYFYVSQISTCRILEWSLLKYIWYNF